MEGGITFPPDIPFDVKYNLGLYSPTAGGQRGADPTGSGSATLRKIFVSPLRGCINCYNRLPEPFNIS